MSPWIFFLTLVGAAPAHDHLTDHNWQLEIEGVTQGAFKAVDGLDSETELVFVGGDDLSATFLDWADGSLDESRRPLDFTLIYTADDGTKLIYEVQGAEVVAMKGKGNSAMQEEIEMVIERLERG